MPYTGDYDVASGNFSDFDFANYSNLGDPSYSGASNQLSTQESIPTSDKVYDQSDVASGGSPSFDLADLSNGTFVGPSYSEFSNELVTQDLMPTSRFGESSMQPTLVGSPYRECPKPTPPISTSYSFQHPPTQNHSVTKTTNKRPRSPNSTQEQQPSAIRTLSRQTGVPENALNTFCFKSDVPDPAHKRTRTISEKKNKKDVRKAGGSCFLCSIAKRKVFPFRHLRLSLPIRC